MDWDLARLWHALARTGPHRLALRHGDLTVTWREFDLAAAAVADYLRSAGIRRGDVAALCLPNQPEYLILLAGALRCGVTPCGVNYRYRPAELVALLRRVQPAAVFYDAADTATVTAAQPQLPAVRTWSAAGDDAADPTALTVRRLLGMTCDAARIDSSPHDTLLKCTGGTTAAPTAIRWRITDVLNQLNNHNPWQRYDLRGELDEKRHVVGVDARLLVASPLIHGSGLTRALGVLCAGGTVITMPERTFQPTAILNATAAEAADSLAIVGDAHAVPLADTLDAHPGRWPLPTLTTITSSGAAWTHMVKQRLLRHLPHLRLVESLGATEATGLGFSTATAGAVPPTGHFTLGRDAMVFRPDRTPAVPGEHGAIGVAWPHPAGLHPHGQLLTDRFVDHGGRRYLLSGDQVTVLPGGRFAFLGRDVDCINTGGEKVYAPEVAEVLASHPSVLDAAVFAVPHPRLGTTVAAVLHLRPGGRVEVVLDHARGQLAGYKQPTIAIGVPAVPRTSAGKVDLVAARALVAAHHGADA